MTKLIEQRVDELRQGVAELKIIINQLVESSITIEDIKKHFDVAGPSSSVEDEQPVQHQTIECSAASQLLEGEK